MELWDFQHMVSQRVDQPADTTLSTAHHAMGSKGAGVPIKTRLRRA